ncbi:helix-turn-helix domain-containing protein [Streptomyces sp. NPDC058751]|uniref:helix-turn-helix domain-containing protein n=1 Tax=Streptomyces sp. NPDC058751 TaxID=3346623 RepID=UPI0036AD9E5E
MSTTCEHCGTALTGGPGKGRPRKYCGDACRQAAHRRRLHGDTAAPPAEPHPPAPNGPAEDRPVPRAGSVHRPAAYGPSAGDELLVEIARDIQDGARDLARLLPSCDGEEPLQRIAQLHEQLDGLTAAVVGRARYRRVTWSGISSALRISEDTARHRYSERYILRCLARFNRTETVLTSLTGLFSSAPARSCEPAEESAADNEQPGAACPPGGDLEQQTAPAESTGAAYNRLAPILSMLIRTAQLTNKEVSEKIGCSASYLSRILSGERVPTWELTSRFAHACGADPEVLRTVWESEKLSQKNRETPPDPDDTPRTATERLRVAIQTLHLRAGRPAPNDVAIASRWLLSTSAVASILEASFLPHHAVLETFVRVLGGDSDHFHRLLDDARNEASQEQLTARPPTRSCPTPAAGADAVIKAFSKVLTEDQPVEDGRARLLLKLARRQTSQSRPTSGTRTRTLTALTDALRHRSPAPAITPLHTGT